MRRVEVRICVFGGLAVSKRTEGPCGAGAEPKKEERRGRMNKRRRGRREDKALDTLGEGSKPGGCAVVGRLRGRPPPNWCTRTPGPPPILKTKFGPVSNRPPPEWLR